MNNYFKKNKLKILLLPLIIFVIFFYFKIDNKCLNLSKLFRSYNDFGYANIKPCYINNIKNLIKQKIPKLFSFLSDFNRYYFSKYDKDILELDYVEDYELTEKELFKEVIDLAKKGIPGLIKQKNKEINYEFKKYKKSYKYYSRQNKNNSNTKFYEEITLKKINKVNKPILAWKHTALDPKKKTKNWKTIGAGAAPTETTPIYLNGKIIFITANYKLIAVNAENGKLIWEKELLHRPSIRGFIVEIDNNNKENIYIGVGSNIFKLNAKTGKLIKSFGLKGHVKGSTAYSPVIFEKNLVLVTKNTVEGFDKYNGKKVFSIPIINKRNFIGANPWGGMALDEEKGLIFLCTGNPYPKTYGVKRQGTNHGSNSIIAVDIIKKKIIWTFQETFHGLWNLDIAFPPILASLNINNKNFDVLISFTKTGNFIFLERTTGKPIFDINFIKVPKSKIYSEVTSPYQMKISKPEPILNGHLKT